MFLKAAVFAFLAVGVLAEYQLPEDKRQQMRDILTQQCKKNGAEDKVDSIENAAKTFVDCLKGLVDVNTLKNEIEEAKPNGALDEVFKKYCAKSPQLKTCINTMMDAVTPCLDSGSVEQVGAAKSGTSELIDFVCYKDGDRIALFIAEKGPECFQEQTNAIKECGTKMKDSFPSVEAASSLSMADRCGKFDELTTCIVTALEKCSTPTPANMAESLFRYVRKGSPCKTALPK